MRKLAIASGAFSAAVFLAVYVLPHALLLYFALFFALSGAGALLLRYKWRTVAALCCFGICFGLVVFSVHYRRTTAVVEAYTGETLPLSAVVTDYSQKGTSLLSTEIRVLEGPLKGLRGTITDAADAGYELKPGDVIQTTVRIKNSAVRYGERDLSYSSKNLYFSCSAENEILGYTSDFYRVLYFPQLLGRGVADRITALFPADTVAFFRALLIGDRSAFNADEQLSESFVRAGFMHVVAVSGMHIAFLVGVLQFLLGKSKRASVCSLALVWIFAFASGATASVLRSALMQSMVLLAPFFHRENDGPTSLLFALALLLLLNPYAAASVGLQLSFGAMAGILLLSEPLMNLCCRVLRLKKRRGFVYGCVGTVVSSVTVSVFTVPISILQFGYVSLLSPLTNMIALWMVSFIFAGGYLACFIGCILPGCGCAVAWLVAWGARYVIGVTKLIGLIPFALYYPERSMTALWILLCYGLIAVVLESKGKMYQRIPVPALTAALTLLVMLGAFRGGFTSRQATITVLDVGQGQCVTAFSKDYTMVVDCGSIFTRNNAGQLAGTYLKKSGRESIDVLILTHLHADHANGVEQLMKILKVGTIILPVQTNPEDTLYETVERAAKESGTELLYLTTDASFSCGKLEVRMIAPDSTFSPDDNERCISVIISVGDYDLLITGDSPQKQELALAEKYSLKEIEALVVGHHGSKYAASDRFLELLGGNTAIISTGYNTYGHPTAEVLERLQENGYNILRTDLQGNIEIGIG